MEENVLVDINVWLTGNWNFCPLSVVNCPTIFSAKLIVILSDTRITNYLQIYMENTIVVTDKNVF